MNVFRRIGLGLICLCLTCSSYGCFLFGGGKKESLEKELSRELAGKEASALALQDAGKALEEGNYDNVVADYNRAIQADSTNVDLYMDLASVYQQLSEIRRDNKNIDEALQENLRGIKVLETLVNKRLVPAVEEGKDLSTLRGSESSPAIGADPGSESSPAIGADAAPASSDTTKSAP